MADNFQTKNVYVDTEYDNIVVIDPNLIQDLDGQPKKRLVQHEDLVYYANLETRVVPRTKLAVGQDLEIINTGIASFVGGDENDSINFLRPKKNLQPGARNYFDTSWSDQITGKNSRIGGGSNQKVTTTITDNNGTRTSSKDTISNYKDTQTLGIKSISVKTNAIGVPTVDMTLVDVQGRTLFEQGEDSLYSIFFNLPYPAFYLTLKGYYGKAIRYQLSLISFNAKLDSKSGNFDIQLKLIGKPGALLFDTLFSYGKTLPKMFKRDVQSNGKQITSNQVGVGSSPINVTTTSLGRQELEATYDYYESKGLIPQGFPRLSIEDFTARVEAFNKWLLDETTKGDFQVLSDVYRFRKDLDSLKREVFEVAINTNLNTDKPFYIGNQVWYPYKTEVGTTKEQLFNSQVKDAIDLYVGSLKSNASFGSAGVIKIPEKPDRKGTIPVNVDYNKIVRKINFNTEPLTDDDYRNTYFLRYGKTPEQDSVEYERFRVNLITQIQSSSIVAKAPTFAPTPVDNFLFTFGNQNLDYTILLPDGFLQILADANAKLDEEEKRIENELSQFLAKTATSTNSNGLGFVPTIRNVFAVLFAGIDSFLRLMDKTHTNAWNLRKDPIRLSVIKEPNKLTGPDKVVYPWPLYYEEESNGKSSQYVIQYVGDPKYTTKTKGNIYPKWPEVEFTEEYLLAVASKLPTVASNSGSPNAITKKASLNSIYKGFDSYQTTLEAKTIGEVLERSYVNSHYGQFNFTNFQSETKIETADLEGQNILDGIINSPGLIDLFKNQFSNGASFLQYIKSNFPNSIWFKYINNIFNTEYLIEETKKENQTSIYSLDYLTTTGVSTGNEIKLKIENYLKDTKSNEKSFLNTYPFTENTWINSNMSNTSAGSFEDTTNIFVVQDNIKKVARLNKNENSEDLNLFTNSKVFTNGDNFPRVSDPANPAGPKVGITNSQTLQNFFKERTDDSEKKDFYITETELNYGTSYNGRVNSQQTNSILNTPYFVNALMKGVELEKVSGETPYAALGYIFLNSLPLITTRERIKKSVSGDESDLSYLASSFNKLSAIHQLPYAWVLKYGSIWYRYKRWVEKKEDILDDVWKDFDYSTAFDPTGSSKTKIYEYQNIGEPIKKISLQNEILGVAPEPLKTSTYEVGFYPKVINDVYYYFTKKDLFENSAYTNTNLIQIQNDKKLVIKDKTQSNFVSPSSVSTNFETTNLNTYYCRMYVKDNKEFPFYIEDSLLLFPSFGDQGLNQAVFECFDDNKIEKIPLYDNKSFYNGTVRSLWMSPNYGYYDHSLLKKPQPDQYIKKIKSNAEVQNPYDILNSNEEYSSVEEIFGVFDKYTLDIFEKYFLLFIDTFAKTETILLESELFSATLNTPPIKLPVEERRLYYLIKSLFVVDNVGPLANTQMKLFTGFVKKFLSNDIILRNGNPNQFDRKTFNDFSESVKFATNETSLRDTYNPYAKNLPPNLTLSISESGNEDQWKALKTYIGFSTISELQYKDQGSYITDFFIDFNVEFTVDNIIKYQQLIKLYATQKLKDPATNKTTFRDDLTNYLLNLETYQTDMLTETIRYLKNNLPTVTNVSAASSTAINGNVLKLETYSTFKTLNDKWISGNDFTTKTLFEDFLFMDRANNDIGDKFTVDTFTIKEAIEFNEDGTMMDLISRILGDNKFVFFAMPAYVNFYNLQKAVKEGEDIPYDIPNSMFGTYLNVDYINSKPTFLCVYVGKESENINSDNKSNVFDSDSMDLTKPAKNTLATSQVNIDKKKSNLVVGFNVDFGIQNQNIFKDLSLDMSEKKNTAETYRINEEIASSASGNKVAQQSQSMYNIYRTRSYTCEVSSMGNVMIQPTMYFNLRHVPLFRGTYWIKDVDHNIDEKEFKTKFTGVKMSLFSLPDPDNYLASINKNLLERIKPDAINRNLNDWPTVTGFTTDPNAVLSNTPLLDTEGACKSKLDVKYETFSSVPAQNRPITGDEYKTKLNVISDINIKRLLFGTTILCPSNTYNGQLYDQINVNNYNLFGFLLDKPYYASIEDFFKNNSYACVVVNNISYPHIDFVSYEKCIDMAFALYGPLSIFITELYNKSTEFDPSRKFADVLTRIYIGYIQNTWPTTLTLNADNLYSNPRISATDPEAFDAYLDIFERVVNIIN